MGTEHILITFVSALFVGAIAWGLIDLAWIAYAIWDEKRRKEDKE